MTITSGITVEGGGGTGAIPPAGPQGPSAYDVAVQAGFVGSVSQWLASLQGPGADPTSLNAAVSRAAVAASNASGFATTAGAAAASAATTLTNLGSQITAAVQTVIAAITATLNAAVTSATASATAAGQSATAAGSSAVAASGAVTSATTQASAASTSAGASAGSATAASTSAGNSALSATASASSATTAQAWAMQTSGTVDGSGYSAKYWAQQAAQSAASISSGPVTSVNSKTGIVALAPSDIGAAAVDASGYLVPAATPPSFLVDPAPLAGCAPSFDYRLIATDCLPPGPFSRLSTGYRTLPSGLLQSVAAGGLRIEHNPITGANLGALIEDALTNLTTYSEQVDNAAWIKSSGLTVSADNTAAPNGVITADKIVENTSSSAFYAIPPVASIASNASVCFSVYVKAAGRSVVQLWLDDGTSAGAYANFNLATGTVTLSSAAAPGTLIGTGLVALSNGWFRAWIAATTNSTTARGLIAPEISPTAARGATYTGDGSSGLYLWGAQIEAGPFPTSYIPTTAAQATRAADTLLVPLTSDWFNSVEGTIYVDAIVPPIAASRYPGLFAIDSGANNNGLQIIGSGGISNPYVECDSIPGGSKLQQFASAPAAGTSVRFALAYTATGVVASMNGAATISIAQTFPVGLTNLRIGVGINGAGNRPCSQIRRLAYFPRAQSAAILQSMTS